MSLSSSLNAGVAGLSANATRLAVISDNIANSSTNGYRRADVDFASLIAPSGEGSFTAGGVRTSTFREVTQAGALITSGNATDIAVGGGNGLLPVTEIAAVDQPAASRPFMMTATGAFRQDEEGFLVTSGGLALLGWPTDADGTLATTVSRDSPASLEPVRLAAFLTAAEATTEIELGVNLPASETIAGASGTAISAPLEYFDSIGRSHQLNIVYTPNVPAAGDPPSDQWLVSFFDSATSDTVPIAEIDLQFDPSRPPGGAGALLSATPFSVATFDATTGQVEITVAGGPISVQLQSVNGATGLIQLDAPFTPSGLSKNGAPAGNLTNVEIDESGFLQGVYDTGQRRTLFQVPLGAVTNPNGLIAVDNQAFQISPESGTVFFFDAGTGPVGTIEGFALQQSSVDVAQELTDLIQTQRAYSSNATTIRTVDEMLQETTNLKR